SRAPSARPEDRPPDRPTGPGRLHRVRGPREVQAGPQAAAPRAAAARLRVVGDPRARCRHGSRRAAAIARPQRVTAAGPPRDPDRQLRGGVRVRAALRPTGLTARPPGHSNTYTAPTAVVSAIRPSESTLSPETGPVAAGTSIRWRVAPSSPSSRWTAIPGSSSVPPERTATSTRPSAVAAGLVS